MRRLAGVAAIIAAVVDGFYYGFVSHPDGHDPLGWRVAFVATFIAVLAITAALSTRASATTWRPALLALSAIGLLSMGFIGIFSIGLPLLIAGALAFVALMFSLAASRQPAGILKAGAGGLLALAIFLGGFGATDHAIGCPATGVDLGCGAVVLIRPYRVACVVGELYVDHVIVD